VCGVEFALGQALGGHMRRHRAAVAEGEEERQSATATSRGLAEEGTEPKPHEARGLLLGLDLNIAPS
jgi:hypothetical protein